MIPRFIDVDSSVYEVVLFCPACAWSIVRDDVTQHWKQCRLCQGLLKTVRVDYPSGQVAEVNKVRVNVG